jgi:hypothetical protein
VRLKGLVEGFFAGVAEGRMADVVDQREGFGEFDVEAQRGGQGAGDLGDFKVWVRRLRKWSEGESRREQAGEDLGLAGQAAEGAGVQDAGGVAGKGRAIGVGRLGVCAEAWRDLGFNDGELAPATAGIAG